MAEGDSNGNERLAGGREFARGIRTPLRLSLIGAVAVMALIGTYFFGKAASVPEARGELSSGDTRDGAEGGLLGTSSPWEVQSSTDPMTDATITQAVATFEGGQFNIEVAVSCSSAGDIAYSAASFDKDGQPAEMRSEVQTSTTRFWGVNGPRQERNSLLSIPFQMRADDNPPLAWSTSNPQYNNQIVLRSGALHPLNADGSGGDGAEQMAAASKVALRLFLTTGEETYEWPQTDAAFRNVVGPCLGQRQAKRAELTATRQQKEAAERRENQTHRQPLR